jgi:BirA family biotin operon repressor/biotin-[acetyl-CoA-carboxylase] ligase
LNQRLQLLHLLSEGEFHDGNVLAKALGVSSIELAGILELIRADGFTVHSSDDSKYTLGTPIEWLSEARIRSQLNPGAAECFNPIEILDSVDSTNRWLAQSSTPISPRSTVCLAEAQSQGRGRLGRSWYSPPASNLYLSVKWRFEAGNQALQGLSLAIGVAVAEACEALGVKGIGLKWPNDLFSPEGKLGGILIEISQAADPYSEVPVCAIIGIGINVKISGQQSQKLDQAVTDLNTLNRGPISRNQLAAEVLNQTYQVLEGYAEQGLSPYLQRWQQRDVLCHKHVVTQGAGESVSGTALGIDHSGAYLLETSSGVSAITAGSLRLSTEQ